MDELIVKDLYLCGFAKIHTGMGIDTLYLDFESMPNDIYLFVGDSGSGKSSILKSIHPFAFNNATGDESGNSSLIMNGRDGQKRIRYILNGHIITCLHIYMRKQDGMLQVKSYFSIDDEELNPSGLVSTFKELVKQYLMIDETFLTLLALDNNVKGMVEYTAGDRKKLAVKIFNELNIYLEYYKNATARVKELKSILTNVSDKLGRYGNYDKKVIKSNIKQLKQTILSEESNLNKILKDEGGIRAKMEINKESYDKYEYSEGQITSLLEDVERIKGKRHTTKDVTVLENELNDLTKESISIDIRLESLELSIKSELDFKERNLKTKTDLEDSIRRMKDGIDKQELNRLLANIDGELAGLESIDLFPDTNHREKKDELIKSAIYLEELRSLCTDLVTEVEYPDLIPEVVSKMNVKFYENELDMVYKSVSERLENLRNANHLGHTIKIPKIVDDCKTKDCPFKRFYYDAYEILNAKQEESSRILDDETRRLKIADGKRTIYRVVRKLYGYIDSHKEEFCKLPTSIFDPNTFVVKYIETDERMIYNQKELSDSIEYLEQATRKEELLIQRKSIKDQLAGIENTISLYDGMQHDLEKVIQTIAESDEVISIHQKDLDYNHTLKEQSNMKMKEIQIEINLAKELEDKRKEIKDLQKGISSMEESKKIYDALSEELRICLQRENEVANLLDNYRSELNQLDNQLKQIENLEDEKVILANKYNEALLIRDAVSPSKGIPVEFIDDVIRGQMIDAINELMHVAYPDITLLKGKNQLIINDKEFTMPYKKNGVIISDISEASDGERAMLSLSFSLVLIRLVSKLYNIMLLDEKDTALDVYGRSKYIDIIEQYMGTINAKQMFLISHNSMFDMYDNVNLLRTTDTGCADYGKYTINVYNQNTTPL